jgi:uncharacterized sporulation protein YeaH/YhbH (DUF444 family)
MQELTSVCNYCGYLEVTSSVQQNLQTEVGLLFREYAERGKAVGSFAINQLENIWDAVRHFFKNQEAA